MEIVFRPVGYVIVDQPDEVVRESHGGVEGYIEILPEYEPALKGLEGFSHIIVIAYMHKVSSEQRSVLTVRPRRWVKLGIGEHGLPEIGVFASDSPHRPNPIAVTIVELLAVEGRRLKVRGLDLYNGTPVLDIKPYTFSRRVDNIRVPDWYQRLLERARSVKPDVREL